MTREEALEVTVERIFTRSEEVADGCRLWTGPVNNTGYAVVRIPGYGTTTAHRAVYEWAHGGPLPADMHVEHGCHSRSLATCEDARTCLHRRCVQVAHLELLTALENAGRGMRAQATGCKNGHEFTEENTWISRDGRRYCRACNRDRMQAARIARLRTAV